MNAEILFLGLMMFCVVGDNCPIDLTDGDRTPPGRAYLVDGMKESGNWCKDKPHHCTACPDRQGQAQADFHVPYLVFKLNHVTIGDVEIGGCPGVLSQLGCWNIEKKKLCFDLGAVSGSLVIPTNGDPTDEDPDDAEEEENFDWVGSMTYFSECTTGCFPATGLEPGAGRATTWVDFQPHGRLVTETLGKATDGGYSLWKKSRGNPPGDRQRKRTALADGVTWHLPDISGLRIYNCDEAGEYLEFTGTTPRVVILNLPASVFERCTPGGSPLLDHFKMHYQLFADDVAYTCGAPQVERGEPKPNCKDINSWVRGGDLGAYEEEGMGGGLVVDDALCPPAKFP